MPRLRLLAKHLLYFAVCGLYIYTLQRIEILCPIRYAIGIPCPTCGSTRALFHLVRLDIRGYLDYNPMALVSAALLFFAVHHNTRWFGFVTPRQAKGVLIFGAVLIFTSYLFRLFMGQIS